MWAYSVPSPDDIPRPAHPWSCLACSIFWRACSYSTLTRRCAQPGSILGRVTSSHESGVETSIAFSSPILSASVGSSSSSLWALIQPCAGSHVAISVPCTGSTTSLFMLYVVPSAFTTKRFPLASSTKRSATCSTWSPPWSARIISSADP